MQRPNPIPFYAGVIDWYQINNELHTVSFKIPNEIGCTRKFVINIFETPEETMIRIRETIAGYDRYSYKWADDYQE